MENIAGNQQLKTRDVLLTVLLITAGLFYRRYDAFLNPQIYAEDGPVFLQQYLENGWHSLIMPYAGYLHTIPRLTAFTWGSLGVDLTYIPLCYNLTYFVLALWIGIELLQSAYRLGLRFAVVFASVFVLVPIGGDVYMNITNSIWVTSLYLVSFLFIGSRYHESTKGKVRRLVALTLVSLTGPFSLLLSPAAFLIVLLERKQMTFRKLVPYGVIMLGGCVQFLLIITSNNTRGIPGTPEEYHLYKLAMYLMNDLYFQRNNLLPAMPSHVGIAISSALFLVIIYFLAVNYKRINAPRKYLLLITPVVYLGSFIAAFWPMEAVVFAVDCPRYYFVPYTVFAWILIIGSDGILRVRDYIVFGLYFLLQGRNEQKILEDKHWVEKVQEYKEGKRQNIEINPDNWQLAIPEKKK